MANFKVGQKCRVVGAARCRQIAGREVILVKLAPVQDRPTDPHWILDIEGLPAPPYCAGWGAWESELAPLTDPRAQEFIEDMERFAVLNPRIKVDPVVAERLREFDRNFTD